MYTPYLWRPRRIRRAVLTRLALRCKVVRRAQIKARACGSTSRSPKGTWSRTGIACTFKVISHKSILTIPYTFQVHLVLGFWSCIGYLECYRNGRVGDLECLGALWVYVFGWCGSLLELVHLGVWGVCGVGSVWVLEFVNLEVWEFCVFCESVKYVRLWRWWFASLGVLGVCELWVWECWEFGSFGSLWVWEFRAFGSSVSLGGCECMSFGNLRSWNNISRCKDY